MHENSTDLGLPDANLAELVRSRAAQHPQRVAFTFESDSGERESFTFGQLDERAQSLAAWLSRQVPPGDRVLLVYPPGLEFIAAFLGCVYAGVLPVPATYPKPRRPSPRLDSIAADCKPSLVLTHSSTLAGLCLEQQSPAISSLTWELTDQIPTGLASDFTPVPLGGKDLAFLQYTSGSTSEPRGVRVSHRNILHNLEAIRACFGLKRQVTDPLQQGVFWLPAYHDMGLIGAILTPLYVGGTSHLIAPTTFLRSPLRWLDLISEHRAAFSGAPNFGYELAVRRSTPAERDSLDLRNWRVAFCGAEPVNPDTLDEFATAFAGAGFRPSAFLPCYGLAESTLLVSGGQHPAGPRVVHLDRAALGNHRVVTADHRNGQTRSLVSCGPACRGIHVEIVEEIRKTLCASDQIGEIWVRGDSIADGYWNRESTNEDIFAASLGIAESEGSVAERYLRTGDLGFCHEGELFVTGRLKDVIIVRGRNHYPQDLERTAQAAHEAVDQGAAFSVDIAGTEQLVLVHQWRRECRQADWDEVLQAIRTAVVEEHEIDPHAIVLIRPASLPITSSGKVQRQRCREMYLAGQLSVTTQWTNSCQDSVVDFDADGAAGLPVPEFLSRLPELTPQQFRQEMETWLVCWLARRANLQPHLVGKDTPLTQLAIDSLTAVEISQEIDNLLGLQSPPMAMWSCATPGELAEYLTGELHSVAKS
jgi:acyl-CoA synthetase (AMP-forming)/AMP-acid ligase II/acyl carrier protein